MSFYVQTGVPIYRCFLHLTVCEDVETARKKMSDKFGAYLLGRANALASSSENGSDYGLFYSLDSLTPGIIAHEIFHITHRIMHDIRGVFDVNNQEPHAYLNEWITNWVYSELKAAKLI